MSPAKSSPRRASGAASLVGLAVLGLLGLLGRKAAPALAMAKAPAVPGTNTGNGNGNANGTGTATGTREARPQSGRAMPSDRETSGARRHGDSAPGEAKAGDADIVSGVRGYAIGLGLAALLTAGSFWLSATHLVYGPGVHVALVVFAVAQVGIHLVFFLHLTTSPDNTNNAMALAFGTLMLVVLIAGTLWIMGHMNANMMPMGGMAMPHGSMMNMNP